MNRNRLSIGHRALFLVATLFAPVAAFAHSGEVTGGLLHGLLHPLVGLDHLLAMVAVGVWAFSSAGRALWALPVTFVGVMLVGAMFAMGGFVLPGIETGILLSVVALGVAVAVGLKLPLLLGVATVGLFALFHGFAHGVALSAAVSTSGYMLGFAMTTALLHLGGIAIGYLLLAGRPLHYRLAGGAIAAAGLAVAAI